MQDQLTLWLTEKRCTQCGERKPLTEFYKRGDSDRYRSHCKACVNASNRQWSEQNRDLHRALSSAWQKRNRARANARWREWQKRSGYSWYALNPERARALWREDAQRRALGRNPEAIEYAAILRRDPCSYCGAPAEQIDHITPVASGGSNGWDNLTAACAWCNNSKNKSTLLEFMRHAIQAHRKAA